MLSIIITAYKEPRISKTIDSILRQKIRNYELLCLAPDKETSEIIKWYAKKYRQIKYIHDPGVGKYTALNIAIGKAKGKILIFTDGDVWLNHNSINNVAKTFNDKKVGIATGRVVSADYRDERYGYWSHLLTDFADKIRKERTSKKLPITISGYLWAFRKGMIKKLPLDIAEDVYASYYASSKGWKIAYADKAEVFVKYPKNFHDWSEQKIRSILSGRNVKKYFKDIDEMRTFSNEASGFLDVLGYARNFREFVWTLMLIPARAYVWIAAKSRNNFSQRWKRIESSK